jgi:hypothetical protein
MTPNVVYALYMLVCVIAAVLVWRVPALDLRGVGRVVRRPPRSLEEDDGAYVSDAERMESARFEIQDSTPRADLLLLTLLGALAGVGLAAFLGWVGPLALSGGAPDQGWSLVGARPMERLAQVVGALSGIAIGLRTIRIFMLLGALVLATGLTLLAANFVLNRALFAGFG